MQAQQQINDNAPAWQRVLCEARRAAWASLTPDEQAHAMAHRQAKADAGAVKRDAKRKLRREIGAMVIRGDKLEEISAATGRTATSLWGLRLYWGLPIAVQQGWRRLFAWHPDAEVSTIDAIAADMGVDRQRAHDAVLRAVYADDGLVARRTLGIKRRAVAA